MGKFYRIGEFTGRIGRSPGTVRRWEREGLLAAQRTHSGQRYCTKTDVRSVLNLAATGQHQRSTVIYCRVCSSGQRAEWESQVASMDQFCLAQGVAIDETVREVADGMDRHRPTFLQLRDRVEGGQVERLLVVHRIGWRGSGSTTCITWPNATGVEIMVVNAESLSSRQEFVEDLVAIVPTFSYRLCGLGRHERQLTDEFGGAQWRSPASPTATV